MTSFAGLQSAFQKAILDGDESVLAELMDGPSETRAAMLGVYRNAYALRLIEAIRKDHEALHAYVGDEMFDEMAAAYLVAHPSRHPSVRWISRFLPGFLAETEPYNEYPVLAELAALEKALNDAFDAQDDPVLAAEGLSEVLPEAWHDLIFVAHASVRRLSFTTNVAAIWTAVRAEEDPPEAVPQPEELIVWRHDATPMLRELSYEEAMMWDEAARALPFGQLCVMLATYDDPAHAPARAAGYLSGWITAGLVSRVVS